MSQQRLHGLDLLRGIAALCVLGFHLNQIFPGSAGLFRRAYLSVDFFFMLSGFVLTRTYQQRLTAGLGAIRFLRIRINRLWPTVAIGALVGLPSVAAFHDPGDLALFLALNLALLPYLGGAFVVFPLNGVIWSIFFELIANAIHALLLFRLRERSLVVIACAMGLIMILIAAGATSLRMGSWDVGAIQGTFAGGLPRVMLSYVIGSLLFLTRGEAAMARIPWWLAPVALPLAIGAGALFSTGWQFDALFVVLICPALMIAGLSSSPAFSRVSWWSGELSFPLYAVHVPVVLLAFQAGLPWYAVPPLAVGAAFVVLALTRRWPWRIRRPNGRTRPLSVAA